MAIESSLASLHKKLDSLQQSTTQLQAGQAHIHEDLVKEIDDIDESFGRLSIKVEGILGGLDEEMDLMRDEEKAERKREARKGLEGGKIGEMDRAEVVLKAGGNLCNHAGRGGLGGDRCGSGGMRAGLGKGRRLGMHGSCNN